VSAALGLLLLPSTAGAQDRTVSGRCSIEGTATYGAPVTNTPADNTYVFDGTGVCNGQVDGRAVSEIRVRFRVTGQFRGSCGDARSTEPGTGVLTWDRGTSDRGDDVSIEFFQDFVASGTDVALAFRGQKSGTGNGNATFATRRTPPDVALRCATSGVDQLPFDAAVATGEPLVSGPIGALVARLDVPPQDLGSVRKRGLEMNIASSKSAVGSLAARISKASARKLGLSSTKIGSVTTTVPSGARTTAVTLKLTSRARKALAKAKSVTVTVAGRVKDSSDVHAVEDRVTLKR
jgi:hypothetical protein